MKNTTNCELCGDNKLKSSTYCKYCEKIMENQSLYNENKCVAKISLNRNKLKTVIILLTIIICVLLIFGNIYDILYNTIISNRNNINSNFKRFIYLLVIIVLAWLIIYKSRDLLKKEKEKEKEKRQQKIVSEVENKVIGKEIEYADPIEEERDLGEVFYVGDDSYTYNEAKAACKKYGAELAKPSHVYKMYKKGEGWCDPGWSEGQHVIFPATQEKVTEANSNDETKGSCGKVGLNGMFERNMNNKYGANCWKNTSEPNEYDYRESDKYKTNTDFDSSGI